MEILNTTAVHHYETMDLSDGNDPSWEGLDKSLKIMSLTIFSIVLVLGVLGNGVVIWVTGFRMKKTINTVWYLNLAVADFLLVAAFLPLRITERAMDFRWPFGKFMCKLNSTVFITNMFASGYILMVISVDRCVCVVWPVWAQNHRSVRKASFVSLGVWVLSLALSSPRFIFTEYVSSYHRDNIGWCDDEFTFGLFRAPIITHQFIMGFVVPFTVIVCCYSVIIYRLRRNRSLNSHSGCPFKIIAAVITAFFLCWAPYHIIQLITLRDFSEYSAATLHIVFITGFHIAVSLAFLNSCLNPLLYVFMGQDFKDIFRRSVLKVLEKAFSEELPQTNTPTNPGITSHSKENSFSEAQV